LETPIAIAIGGACGVVISAVVTGVYNLLAKRTEYANEYYKVVIVKRIAAYQQLETLIASLKLSVLDIGDGKAYHLIFAKNGELQGLYSMLADINLQALWLSEGAFEKAKEFNYHIFRSEGVSKTIEFRKENYRGIAVLREEMENIVCEDMSSLHNVRPFLRRKARRKKQKFAELAVTDAGLQKVKGR